MASNFTGGRHRGVNDELLKRVPGRTALRMAYVRDLRGSGVGSRLLDDVEERAREMGPARICLDVAASNEGARTS